MFAAGPKMESMAEETLWCEREESIAALIAVSAVLDAFHRVLICLDPDFRIVHASTSLGRLIGEQNAAQLTGRPVAELLGSELFGPGGALRDVLEQGELREGWRASMRLADGTTRLVSCSAAPFKADADGICDPGVA
ncbi:MAG: PAS domain-containing protein, partial [Thermoanaerobaculia bacterium]